MTNTAPETIVVYSFADYAPFMQGDDLIVRDVQANSAMVAGNIAVRGDIFIEPGNAELPVLLCKSAHSGLK